MAKGKGRKQDSGEDEDGAPRRAPQAAVHKRGGTHRVKDGDRTGTKYDDWDYAQLKPECIDRKIYVKDMKKAQMARALAEDDNDKEKAERGAHLEHEQKMRLLAKEKQREDEKRLKIAAKKHKRRIERQARRDRDESVSEDTPDEEELRMMHNELLGLNGEDEGQEAIGQLLSDDSWDSTSTETTVRSKNSSIDPGCRLRLFEWPYVSMPSPTGPRPPPVPGVPSRPRRNPASIPYIPLKVHTTETKEKLFLPGHLYPPTVDPDFVPVLAPQIRNAARNGILEGAVRKATIERASTWASRTRIQGWNARMFFSLPPRKATKNLREVYNDWYLENRRLLCVKPTGDGERLSRDKRHAQRHKNKAKKLAEVLETSMYRPTAICYLPAYLDFDTDKLAMGRRQRKQEHTLENLFFIRFPSIEVPHYYFWTRHGEWADPTTPNLEWNPEDTLGSDESTDQSDQQTNHNTQIAVRRLSGLTRPARPVHQTFIRVRNSTIYSSPPVMTPATLANTAARVEHYLCTHGLAVTLTHFRKKWLANGNEHAWKVFGNALPLLYPSGQMPRAPPVRSEGNVSVATEIASIDMVGAGTVLSPFRGDEPWTSDDDAFWDVVEIDDDGNMLARAFDSTQEDVEMLDPSDLEALYRRPSTPFLARFSSQDTAAWLQQISPSYAPLTPGSLPTSPVLEVVDDEVRKDWEAKFLQPQQKGMDVTCPFCLDKLQGRTLQQQAEHMYGHSSPKTRPRMQSEASINTLVALPRTARRRSGLPAARVHFYEGEDSGGEEPALEADNGDNERTPGLRSGFKGGRVQEKQNEAAEKRHISEETFQSPVTPSSHIPSPYLPHVKRYPATHPNAAWNSRKRSISDVNSMDFLGPYISEPKKVVPVVVSYGKGRRGREEVFYALERRSSAVADPTYQPPASARAPGAKRRRVVDPSYRPTAGEMEEVPVPELVKERAEKKRKRVADPSYRATQAVYENEEMLSASPRVRKRKVVGAKMQLPVQDTGVEELSTPLLKRRRKSVDLNGEYREDGEMLDAWEGETGVGGREGRGWRW
jgi:hypothetical protein